MAFHIFKLGIQFVEETVGLSVVVLGAQSKRPFQAWIVIQLFLGVKLG